jgi:hypothetical protein
VSEYDGSALPSRRALREATGPTEQVLTRRQMRERELAATGAVPTASGPIPTGQVDVPTPIPPVSPTAPSGWSSPVTPSAVTPPPALVEPPVSYTPPAPPPVSVPEPSPVLSRRERRLLEEGGSLTETGVVPVVSPVPVQTGLTTSLPGTTAAAPPPQMAATEYALPSSPSVYAPQSVEPDRQPLPPVFGPATTAPGVFPAVADEMVEDTATASIRTIGSGQLATHALILPTAPNVDISGPIGDTGEIIVTGQIPLPRLMTETGVQGVLDEDEEGPAFETVLGVETSGFTSPIRATQAVSSKGNDREFEMVRKAPWGTAATILGISAVLLVVAAGGLLALAFFTDILIWPF